MRLVAPSRWSGSVAALALCAATPALAADLEAKSRVESVVVYPDAATITRVADIEAPAGASTIVFHGLPLGLDPNSLRVAGAADAKISIGSVDTRVTPEPPRDSAIEAKLKKLHADRDGWQGTLDALEAKKAMIIRYSQASPEKLSANAQPLDIAQWTNAWDVVGQGLAKIGDDLNAARAQARDLDDQIAAVEQSRQRPRPPASNSRDAVVAISADAAASGQLRLTYRVAGASWTPAYDARLDTGSDSRKASLELARRATIVQHTGEDWTGVTLSLSTTRASGGAQAPDVQTQRAAFWEPPIVLQGGLAGAAPAAPASAPRAKSVAMDAAAPVPAPPPVAAREDQATLDAGAYQATFQIPGAVDVPGDGGAKIVLISTANFAPDLTIKTAPALDPVAYLQARLVNAEDAPLLPGPVNIQRDGTFVGVSRIGLVAPGDFTDIGFGADDRVKISRAPVKRKENEPTWLGQTKTEQREFKTIVKNLHPFAVKVSVVDQIPISESSAIVIEQAPATTPPTDKNLNDRRGVMDWVFDLAPGADKSITLAYRMKWPADRDVVFGPTLGGK